MKPLKPYNEWTIDELNENHQRLSNLIKSVTSLIKNISDPDAEAILRYLDGELKMMSPNLPISGFIELADINIKSFKKERKLIMKELKSRNHPDNQSLIDTS